MMTPASVLVVGGGISGLATAYYLGKAGIRCTLIEKSNRLGGLIQTDRIAGCDLEAGPDSFISIKPAVADLAADLGGGLAGKIIGSNDAARRIFVVRGGKLVPMPKGMSMFAPGEWGPVLRSPLLSARTKWSLLRETRFQPLRLDRDFSVGELVSRHFTPEMLEYVADPLLSGVYGGDSASLSARSVLPRFVGFEEQFGSLIKGVRAQPLQAVGGTLFRSFEGGMQTLTDALTQAMKAQTAVIHAEAEQVERTEDGWRVNLAGGSLPARQVVLACPAWVSAKLLQSHAPALGTQLSSIPYSSAVLATLVFKRDDLRHPLDGFGFLVPRRERRSMAAATWINTKFPSRVANGLAALRAFLVGDEAKHALQSAEAGVVRLVQQDFARLMGIQSEPQFHTLNKWPQSMPQYVVGHEARIQALTSELARHAGLSLTGNYFDGVGIPDCIRRAKQVAKRIADDCV